MLCNAATFVADARPFNKVAMAYMRMIMLMLILLETLSPCANCTKGEMISRCKRPKLRRMPFHRVTLL